MRHWKSHLTFENALMEFLFQQNEGRSHVQAVLIYICLSIHPSSYLLSFYLSVHPNIRVAVAIMLQTTTIFGVFEKNTVNTSEYHTIATPSLNFNSRHQGHLDLHLRARTSLRRLGRRLGRRCIVGHGGERSRWCGNRDFSMPIIHKNSGDHVENTNKWSSPSDVVEEIEKILKIPRNL